VPRVPCWERSLSTPREEPDFATHCTGQSIYPDEGEVRVNDINIVWGFKGNWHPGVACPSPGLKAATRYSDLQKQLQTLPELGAHLRTAFIWAKTFHTSVSAASTTIRSIMEDSSPSGHTQVRIQLTSRQPDIALPNTGPILVNTSRLGAGRLCGFV
jgi:hypothetical protein